VYGGGSDEQDQGSARTCPNPTHSARAAAMPNVGKTLRSEWDESGVFRALPPLERTAGSASSTLRVFCDVSHTYRMAAGGATLERL
jgi:hypothetical protein